jgi:hypothetical protein
LFGRASVMQLAASPIESMRMCRGMVPPNVFRSGQLERVF